MSDPSTEAREAMREILDNPRRGPDRVMEVQRARMWEHDPRAWTRYERLLSAALEQAERAHEATTAALEAMTEDAYAEKERAEKAERALEQERDELVRFRGIANMLTSVQTLPGQPLAVQSAISTARAWKALASSLGAAAEPGSSGEHAVVWLLRERTGRPVAAYSDRATAIERRVELARRNPSTLDISVTEVVPVVVGPTADELFDPAAMRKLRAT